MPILSLCSGYGGLDMAVEALTGDKVAYVAESDEVASLVLAHHWPDVPNIGDISTYDFARLRGEVDAIAAGFPCQPTSNAGRRLGVLDERWLWPHVARAVRDIRPGYVFLENVDAIRHRNRGLGVVLADLAEIGYDAWWVCLPASVVGAAHIRWRWFAVAIPADAGRQGLATGHVEAGDRRAALERGGLVPQDPHGSARNERLSSAPRKASGGGSRPHAR